MKLFNLIRSGDGDWGLGIGPNPQSPRKKKLFNIFY